MPIVIAFIIIFIFFFFLGQIIQAQKEPEKANLSQLQAYPGYMSILGILGTFIGILIGLNGFDIAAGELQSNISTLLGGLKTAFSSSVVGLIGYIILSMMTKHYVFKVGDKFPVVRTPEQELLEKLLEETKAQGNQLSKLAKSLDNQAGQNADALQAGMKEMLPRFNETIEKMVSALVDENFKQLKESIDRMAAWQEQHQKNMEHLHTKLNETVHKLSEVPAPIEAASREIAKIRLQLTKSTKSLKTAFEDFEVLTSPTGALATTFQQASTELNATLSTYQNATTSMLAQMKDEMDSLIKGTRSFEDTQQTINQWLSRESGIHTAMVTYSQNLKEFQQQITSIKQTDLDSMQKVFQENLVSAMNLTFHNLDSLIKEYLTFNETLIRDLKEKEHLVIELKLAPEPATKTPSRVQEKKRLNTPSNDDDLPF